MSDTEQKAGFEGGEERRGGAAGHVMSARVLTAVWCGLLVLTVMTVGAAHIDFGSYNLWIAMVIATMKGSLVVLYFMHMRYERPFNAVVLITALAFVTLFVSLTLMDSQAYQPELIPGYAPGISR